MGKLKPSSGQVRLFGTIHGKSTPILIGFVPEGEKRMIDDSHDLFRDLLIKWIDRDEAKAEADRVLDFKDLWMWLTNNQIFRYASKNQDYACSVCNPELIILDELLQG